MKPAWRSSTTIVGIVMQKLKDIGVDDNTIVVFTTDNGTESLHLAATADRRRSRRAKGTVMEGGFRVAGMIRWPGKVPAARSRTASFPGWTGSRPSWRRPATRTSPRS